MIEISVFILILLLGFVIGFLTSEWTRRRSRSSGVIHVSHSRGKTLYSLELSDYPEKLEFKKKVIFTVESDDRE
jgi:hypothetical protein